MEKTKEEFKGFGKEEAATAARNDALERFMTASEGEAYRLAWRLTKDENDARELVQETLYRVTKAWESYDQRKPLKTWFLVILRNAFRDSRKSRARRKLSSLEGAWDSEEEQPVAELISDGSEGHMAGLEREETLERVRQALATLQRNHRRILRLCDLQGRTMDEIARKLGIPSGTARSRVFRARQAFRDQSPELASLA